MKKIETSVFAEVFLLCSQLMYYYLASVALHSCTFYWPFTVYRIKL